MFLGAALTAIALIALLMSEWRESRTGIRIAKPLASAGFLIAAVGAGANDSRYGMLIFAALVLSFAGDVLLITPATFLPGLASFLAAHVVFAIAFSQLETSTLRAAVAAIVMIALGTLLWHWLAPKLPQKYRAPVAVYVFAIVTMVTIAMSVRHSVLIPIAAVAFFASDIAVARHRFVTRSISNKLWGLPLYYAAQLMLAASVHQFAINTPQ